MRQLTDIEIGRIKVLTENSVELALIEPTKNGLEKSIMDATVPICNFLRQKGVHDYFSQNQGTENKVLINSILIRANDTIPSIASLYRPVTKKGDPRIWFKGLGLYSNPNDILALFFFDGNLCVLNITQIDISSILHLSTNSPLKDILSTINFDSSVIALELLDLIRSKVGNRAVPSMLNADTSVGRTLETMLGIDINSSQKPDYKGIELKAFRDKKGNRKNLFAQVPDWPISKFKSSAEILNHFGYSRGEDTKLYCTVSSIVRNSQGLKLSLDIQERLLLENSDKLTIGDFIAWKLETLHRRLLEKHNETFWISAESSMENGSEYFQFKKIEHTRKPIISQFDLMLEQGIITIDHLIKRTPNGKVVEKGPLFKIKPNAVSMLFPPSKLYTI
jgi:hypothetical protein